MAKILFTCFGSYGDLHPYIGVAKMLQSRGHHVAIGTTSIFQSQIEANELEFIHLRSSLDQYYTPELVRAFLQKIFHPDKGGEYITREMMSHLEETYQDTLSAVESVDIVISNPLAYVTPIVCRALRAPWLSTVLAPMFFLSTYDPPIMGPAPWLKKVHQLSPPLYRWLFKLLKGATKSWVKPLYRLCEENQLPPPNGHPLFEGQYSPHGTLAMFSLSFATPQLDWPVNTRITGFPLFSHEKGESEALQALQIFLDSGEPPIVFALGSSAVHVADDFYVTCAEIARKLKRRAVLIYGDHQDNIQDIPSGKDLLAIPYASYDAVFPRAALIVHQGGIGTLAQSIMAQRPILVVPFGFDQFDNGERVEKLGIGKMLSRKAFTTEKALPVIEELLTNMKYQHNAVNKGNIIAKEHGIIKACEEIENCLQNTEYQ